jgi:glycosyltransferase involved in cell wall biosynthesis
MAKSVSVVITSYNQKDYLREAIESVLAQTLRPFEIIVCDDASTDGSPELIKGYEVKHNGLLRGVFHTKNIKISGNRTSGVESAKGDLVTWLDGDDRYKPRKLEVEMEALRQDPEAKWAYSQVDIIDENGNRKGVRYDNPPTGYILDTLVSMLGGAPRNQLIYRECIKKIGLFRQDMSLYEDFDFCLRLAKNYKACYCPESLVEYRIHAGGLHTLDRQLHIDNYKRLYINFQDLVAGYPRPRREVLETMLVDRINTIAGHPLLFFQKEKSFIDRLMQMFTIGKDSNGNR